ncbi:unnamed protein product [Amoebophrya sp. A120]|nr:unnamed protein product [Amoebophrya sp. A120]|eukprot:GSA120T00007372001.1
MTPRPALPRRTYKCLILDHDDTCVDSTASIHHPAHVAGCRELLPSHEPIDLEGWFRVNHNPGVGEYLKTVFGEDKEVIKREMEIWHDFMKARQPDFYPGMLELLREWREAGGLVAVVSHSPADVIKQHYENQKSDKNPHPFLPDVIYGWREDPSERKPNAWPTLQIMKQFDLKASDCIVLDDLSPGIKMATAAGVKSYACAWQHAKLVSELEKCGASGAFFSVEEFRKHVFGMEEGTTGDA